MDSEHCGGSGLTSVDESTQVYPVWAELRKSISFYPVARRSKTSILANGFVSEISITILWFAVNQILWSFSFGLSEVPPEPAGLEPLRTGVFIIWALRILSGWLNPAHVSLIQSSCSRCNPPSVLLDAQVVLLAKARDMYSKDSPTFHLIYQLSKI